MAELAAAYGAYIAYGAAVVSAGVGVYSAVDSRRAAKATAKSEEAWNQYNAKIAAREAEAEERAGRHEELMQRRKNAALFSTQRARFAKAGVSLGSGSPLMVMVDSAERAESDIMFMREQSQRRALALRSQSNLSILSGQAAVQRGQNQARAAVFSGVQAGLGGVSDVYNIRSTQIRNNSIRGGD